MSYSTKPCRNETCRYARFSSGESPSGARPSSSPGSRPGRASGPCRPGAASAGSSRRGSGSSACPWWSRAAARRPGCRRGRCLRGRSASRRPSSCSREASRRTRSRRGSCRSWCRSRGPYWQSRRRRATLAVGGDRHVVRAVAGDLRPPGDLAGRQVDPDHVGETRTRHVEVAAVVRGEGVVHVLVIALADQLPDREVVAELTGLEKISASRWARSGTMLSRVRA